MTAPTPDPAAEALTAAVPGARGWFRFNPDGAVNVRVIGAVNTPRYDDGQYRIVATGELPFELALGPYTDATTAADVRDAVLQLAYNDIAWPAAA